MAVPDYQTLMRPFLAAHADGGDHAVAEVRSALGGRFSLSDEELAERLPSGRARTFDNRVGWAVTYLYRAGLLARPRRSVYRITERGRDVLSAHPDRIDIDVLNQFEEFRDFRSRGQTPPGGPEPPAPPPPEDGTPEERMDAAYKQMRAVLAADLIDRVLEQDFAFFERLVMDVLGAMGYGRGHQLGGSGDEGFDGLIDEDRLGLDRIYVQAKRWMNPVGRPAVQGFVGALAGRGATKGVFITTSTFTAEAKRYVEMVPARVILIDGQELAQLMVEYGVAVSVKASYDVKRLDLDYFTDEGITDSAIDEVLEPAE